jgi:RNA polymerase sigma-70 factor, ECF subfamily
MLSTHRRGGGCPEIVFVSDADVPSGGAREPSSSLLARVRAQDQRAWQWLVSLYAPLVYRWCRGSGLQAADAADVGQEVFRTVARKIVDFRRDRPQDSFRAWLRTIARTKVLDHLRRSRNEPRGQGGSDAQTLLQQVPADSTGDGGGTADAEDRVLLYGRAVELIRGDFEERTWRAFWRVVVDGQAPADVAGELGMSRDAVYHAKARVLSRLRSEFADLLDLQAAADECPQEG